MKCTVRDLPPPNLTREEWVEMDKISMAAIDALRESLRASQGSVDIHLDPIPADGLKIGMPMRWGYEFYPESILPRADYRETI